MKEEEARKRFGRIIDRGLSAGLFGLDKFRFQIDGDTFGDRTLSVALFVLGCTTASCGRIDDAINLLDHFMTIYKESDAMRKQEMNPAMVTATDLLKKIKLSLAYGIYQEKHDLNKMKSYVDSILSLNSNDYDANLLCAMCYEELDNRNMAKEHNLIASRNAPRNAWAHFFNYAYFALAEGEYLDAVYAYKRIPENLQAAVNVVNDIRVFLYKKYITTGNLAFLFGEGYVTFVWQDERSGKKSLMDFMRRSRKSPDAGKYKSLIEASENLIKSN